MSIFLQCLVLFSGFIPISLYVTLEMVQIVQGMFIHKDEKMVDQNGRGPDVKMFSLNSELGNVKYVMSDKTGTLTQNCMRFRMCSVGGVKYANRKTRRDKEFSPRKLINHMTNGEMNNAEQIKEFLIACALCHTASPEKNSNADERPFFHATSPDEHALLDMAANAGFVFTKRAPGKCVLNVMGRKLEYDLLAVLEFDSIRKRMSVIVREPSGKYKLYIKGADQKIFERLQKVSQKEMKRTAGHLQQFAIGGYRTLCFAVRTIDNATFANWYRVYLATINDTSNRKEKLAQLAEEIERDLTLIGVSAIEDRLQKDVPETVARLLSADIRVWVLTGDKLETAVNIGNSCRLLSVRAPMMVLSTNTERDTRMQLRKYLQMLGKQGLARRDQHISLIVDATCLDYILVSERERDNFLRLALCCSAVICCRCTPIQKAAITRLVKANVSGAVLAIGDGANDVAMLQEADVGVGISGQEGMQAALASDYTITQFSVGIGLASVSLLLLSMIVNTWISFYIPLLPRHVGGMLYMLPIKPLFLVVVLVDVATLLPDIALKVNIFLSSFRRSLRADMQDAMLWQEGFRGPNFNLLYQPIFKICDIVGLKTYGGLESNRYGFAFAQDDGQAVTQMDLLQGCSDSTATIRTAGIEESHEQISFVKPNERSVDDRTVVSSVSKSPQQVVDSSNAPVSQESK
ncbi:hypothetical protein ANCCAN_24747 [Ancylostoma caninum]|uniref:Phospholipid-transporting ATPase n=1 Tax=Ancylostoma caninum TaxID=29170 RepID=A0A368FBC6_ANCCA|nr:hypothetical protein ANCCAN_24747 [Ancylostoma caninum]